MNDKSRPVAEVCDPTRVLLSTDLASYTLRRLYHGLDSRGVHIAFEKGSDAKLFGTSSFSEVQGNVPAISARGLAAIHPAIPLTERPALSALRP